MTVPNRNIQDANGYRYAYQGQEKDPETGKEAFELRLWDGRIGRWLTTDPKGQYHSPYMAMDNNPISSIDPTGGSTDDDYKLIDGVITWTGTRAGEDRLYIGDKYETFDYGFLSGGGNIFMNGFDTGNIGDGIKLAKFISFNEGLELGGFGYYTLTGQEKLKILPYYKSKYLFYSEDDEVFMGGMTVGVDFKFSRSEFPMLNYSILKYVFHTHPSLNKSLLNGAKIDPSYLKVDGSSAPSFADQDIANRNLVHFNLTIPFRVYGQRNNDVQVYYADSEAHKDSHLITKNPSEVPYGFGN